MISLMYQSSFTQVSLARWGFMFKNMTSKSFGTLKFTACCYFKTFCSSSTSFHFWHDSIAHQIIVLGAKETSNKEKADLILAVNTPFNGVFQDSTSNENAPYGSEANKKFAKELSALTKVHPVALADISYANGSDNGFMLELENRNLLPSFAAYSGWNTADNSIGFALAQGVLAKNMIFYFRFLSPFNQSVG